jgi:hypothetical protein
VNLKLSCAIASPTPAVMRSRLKWEVDAVKSVVIMLYQISTSHYTFIGQDHLTMLIDLCWFATPALCLLV